MRSPTAVIRDWQLVQPTNQQRWAVFWGLGWIALNIGLVVFIIVVAAQ